MNRMTYRRHTDDSTVIQGFNYFVQYNGPNSTVFLISGFSNTDIHKIIHVYMYMYVKQPRRSAMIYILQIANIYHRERDWSELKYLQPRSWLVRTYHRGGKYLQPRLWLVRTYHELKFGPITNIYHRGVKSGEKEIQFKRIKSCCTCIKKIINELKNRNV
jgi:hypothetical protein